MSAAELACRREGRYGTACGSKRVITEYPVAIATGSVRLVNATLGTRPKRRSEVELNGELNHARIVTRRNYPAEIAGAANNPP